MKKIFFNKAVKISILVVLVFSILSMLGCKNPISTPKIQDIPDIPENSAFISWKINGQGGSLKAEYVENGVTKELPAAGKNIAIGTKIIFTAQPAPNYAVGIWNAGGGGLSASSDNLKAELIVQDKKSIKITLTFIKKKEKGKLTLKTSANGGLQANWKSGSETISQSLEANTSKTISIEKGTMIELSAKPNAGYEFSNWTGVDEPNAKNTKIILIKDTEITVNFKEIIPVPKSIKINGNYVDLKEWKVDVPNNLEQVTEVKGEFTAGGVDIPSSIQIVGNAMLNEGENSITLKVEGLQGKYGEWVQTIKVKRLSSGELPNLSLKSLKVNGEAVDLNSMTVSVPNDKESIKKEDFEAEFARFGVQISNVNLTVKDEPIQLKVGEPIEVELSVLEKTGTDGYNAWSKTLSVTRKTIPVTGVKISAPALELDIGDTYKLKANVEPSNATNQNVEWKSDNDAIASVDSNGMVKANGEGTAYITVKTVDGSCGAACAVRVIRKFSIEFDSNKIAVLSANYMSLLNREKVLVGDKIYLSTLNLEAGKLPSWKINGKPSSKPSSFILGDLIAYEYLVEEQDAENFIIRFDYSEVESEKLKIKYDSSVKKILLVGDENTEIPNDSDVYEGSMIVIELNLSSNAIIDKCLVNGKPVLGNIFNDSFGYMVSKEDADSNQTLNFSFTVKSPSKVKIHWDNIKSPMICNIENDGYVSEGDEISFTAKLSEGQIVDKWKVNGVEPIFGGTNSKEFWLIVNAEHCANGNIDIGYTTKGAVTGNIKWDKDKSPMTCNKRTKNGWDEIISGGQVQEGDKLNFTAELSQGQIVDKWTVNGVECQIGASPKYFWFILKAEHFKNGPLTIGYTKKGAVKGTIKWDNDKNTMICNNGGAEIGSGDQVQEGDQLNFTAELSQGQIVDKWMVNGFETETYLDDPNSFRLTVKSKHFKNGPLTIGYTKKGAAQAKVSFDSNIRCYVERNGAYFDIESGTTTVYEGERLYFKAMGMPDSAVKGWKINNKKHREGNWHSRWFDFNLKNKHILQASGGVVAVSCELKEGLKNAVLDFDSVKMKCRQDGNELNSGLKIYSGIDLEFSAILSGSQEVKSWKINGLEQENSGLINFRYTVKDEDLNTDNFTVEIVLKQ